LFLSVSSGKKKLGRDPIRFPKMEGKREKVGMGDFNIPSRKQKRTPYSVVLIPKQRKRRGKKKKPEKHALHARFL